MAASIVRPDGTTAASRCLPGSGEQAFLDRLELPVAGTYKVVLDPAGTDVGELTLQLFDVPADVSAEVGSDSVSLPVTVPGQNAVATFTATAGEQVKFSITHPWSTGFTFAMMTLVRVSDNKVIVQEALASSPYVPSSMVAPTDGQYRLLLDPYHAKTGTITLTPPGHRHVDDDVEQHDRLVQHLQQPASPAPHRGVGRGSAGTAVQSPQQQDRHTRSRGHSDGHLRRRHLGHDRFCPSHLEVDRLRRDVDAPDAARHPYD